MAGSKKSDAAPQTFEVGDVVLAKVKGYPMWPARVIDPDTAPTAVKKDRPKGTKTPFYCVCFFPTGDHAWQVTSGMHKLQKHEIEAYLTEPHRKSGELLEAYKIALDPTEWINSRAELYKKLEDEAKEAPIDELDDDADSDKTSKKRKRESDAGDKKKGAKKATPAKIAKPKAEAATPKAAKKRGKKNGAISAPTIAESEDEGDNKDVERPSKKAKGDEDDDDEESMSDEAKMVKAWRHELQRIFLNKNSVIKAEDMEKASSCLKTIEEFGSKMTLALLSSSKLGKVIKKMTALGPDAIPNNDEFKIAERSNTLLGEWGKLASAGTNGDAAPAPASAAEVEANGDSKMELDAPAAPAAVEVEIKDTADTADAVDAEADVEMKDAAPVPAPAPAPAPPAEPEAESAPAPVPEAEAESAPVEPVAETTAEAPVPTTA